MVADDDTARITLYGDKSCEHCDDTDKRFKERTEKSKNIEYKYVDVYSDKGQEKLKQMGIAEGQKVDVPIIDVEKCTISKDSEGHEEKKCGPAKSWKDDWWSSIERDELPEGLD